MKYRYVVIILASLNFLFGYSQRIESLLENNWKFVKGEVSGAQSVTFDIDLERDFGFVNEDGKRFLENGIFYIIVKDQKIKVELID